MAKGEAYQRWVRAHPAIQVRLTAAERDQLVAQATASGLSIGVWARQQLLRVAGPDPVLVLPLKAVDLALLQQQAAAAGRTLEQQAREAVLAALREHGVGPQ